MLKKWLYGFICLACLWECPLSARTVTGFTNNNGVEIYWEDHGREKSQTIVMLHGFPFSGQMFKEQVSGLGDFFRIVTIDQRGFGKSTKTATDYSYPTLVSDVQAVVNQLGLTKFHLMGHSYGSIVSELYALTHPSFVDHLVLVAPYYGQLLNNPPCTSGPSPMSSPYRLGVDSGPLVTLASSTLFVGNVLAFDTAFVNLSLPETCPVRNQIFSFLLSIALEATQESETNLLNAQFTPQANGQDIPTLIGGTQNPNCPECQTPTPAIFAPTLLIYGSNDSLNNKQGDTALRQSLPNSQVLELQGGHMVNLTQSERFNRAVFSFLIGSPSACHTDF